MVELSCGRSARDNKSARDVRMIERAKEKYAPPHRRRRGKMRTGEGRLITGWNGGRSGAPNNCVSLREERARHTERARRLKRTRTARRDDRAASRASTETEGGADRKWTAFSQPPGRERHPKPSDPGDFCSDRLGSGPKSLIFRILERLPFLWRHGAAISVKFV